MNSTSEATSPSPNGQNNNDNTLKESISKKSHPTDRLAPTFVPPPTLVIQLLRKNLGYRGDAGSIDYQLERLWLAQLGGPKRLSLSPEAAVRQPAMNNGAF